MKPASGNGRGAAGSGLTETLSGVVWKRVLLAGVAVHVAYVVVPVVLILAYSLPAGGGSVQRFADLVATWSLPVLTLPAATWAARGTRPRSAVSQGLMVGLLVAGAFGLLYFWPNDLRSLAPFALTLAAGLAGGRIGGGETCTRG